ncbi:MAG: hypothetical protein KKF10_08985, partial [Verrucomicrobia bacterium]|nr:hypothetical protein [Verrucomicrobiota bacterium]
ALFSSEVGAPLIEMRASVRLEPEALKVNPGILTAFVSLPEGYPESGIRDATCDGAAYESMQVNGDGTEMIIKFRRQAIEEALAQQGEELDTHFIVELTWQGDAGTFIFQGEDDITKIVN